MLITHEHDVAARAAGDPRRLVIRRRPGGRMSWLETVRAGVEAIRAHRLRSALTMLGIVIGISSVILTVGLGQGAQDQVERRDQRARQQPADRLAGQQHRLVGRARRLRLRVDPDPPGRRLRSPTPTSYPTPSGSRRPRSSPTALTAGETNWTTTVVGTTTGWLEVRARTLSAGRFFTEAEVEQAADVVVLGPDTASELFPAGSPVGQTVTIDGTPLTVIGVLASTGSSSDGGTEDDQAVLPISTAQRSPARPRSVSRSTSRRRRRTPSVRRTRRSTRCC